MYFSCSYNAFEHILAHTEVICLKVSCNPQKVVERYFSSTENFLFNFLMVQSPAGRWRSSAKPFPPWIAEYLRGNGDGLKYNSCYTPIAIAKKLKKFNDNCHL